MSTQADRTTTGRIGIQRCPLGQRWGPRDGMRLLKVGEKVDGASLDVVGQKVQLTIPKASS
jgi:hypothetical protein